METYTIDLDHYLKKSSKQMLSKEEVLRENPQLALRQHAIFSALCAEQELMEGDVDEEQEEIASLDTSPGLFPYPYFSEDEDLPLVDETDPEMEGTPTGAVCGPDATGTQDTGTELSVVSEKGECPLAIKKNLEMSSPPELKCSPASKQPKAKENMGSLASEPVPAHQGWPLKAEYPAPKEGPWFSPPFGPRKGPYNVMRRPVIAPLVRCSQPRKWGSWRAPAYIP